MDELTWPILAPKRTRNIGLSYGRTIPVTTKIVFYGYVLCGITYFHGFGSIWVPKERRGFTVMGPLRSLGEPAVKLIYLYIYIYISSIDGWISSEMGPVTHGRFDARSMVMWRLLRKSGWGKENRVLETQTWFGLWRGGET